MENNEHEKIDLERNFYLPVHCFIVFCWSLQQKWRKWVQISRRYFTQWFAERFKKCGRAEGHERTGLNWWEQKKSGDLLEPAHLSAVGYYEQNTVVKAVSRTGFRHKGVLLEWQNESNIRVSARISLALGSVIPVVHGSGISTLFKLWSLFSSSTIPHQFLGLPLCPLVVFKFSKVHQWPSSYHWSFSSILIIEAVTPVSIIFLFSPVSITDPFPLVSINDPPSSISITILFTPVFINSSSPPISITNPFHSVAINDPASPVSIFDPSSPFSINEAFYSSLHQQSGFPSLHHSSISGNLHHWSSVVAQQHNEY